ncbi:MAG: DUF4340 domain-containing protein [Bacteroidota bacterium]
MTNRLLLLVLVLLLGVWGLSELVFTKKTSTFKTELIQIDTATVTQFVIQPKGGGQEIMVNRAEDGWIVSNSDLSINAKAGSVDGLLNALSLVKTKRVAAKKAEKWIAYEVGEGQGTRIQIFEGKSLLEDIIVGKFDFNPQTRAAFSFIRLNGENEVYAVDGMPFITLPQSFDAFRNKNLIRMTREMEVTDFSLQFPDTTHTFSKSTGQWVADGAIALDSMKVENYLNTLRNIDGELFADTFEDSKITYMDKHRFEMRGDNIATPFVVDCYTDTTSTLPFVLRSNTNTDSYFSSDSSGVFAKFFVPVSTFLE